MKYCELKKPEWTRYTVNLPVFDKGSVYPMGYRNMVFHRKYYREPKPMKYWDPEYSSANEDNYCPHVRAFYDQEPLRKECRLAYEGQKNPTKNNLIRGLKIDRQLSTNFRRDNLRFLADQNIEVNMYSDIGRHSWRRVILGQLTLSDTSGGRWRSVGIFWIDYVGPALALQNMVSGDVRYTSFIRLVAGRNASLVLKDNVQYNVELSLHTAKGNLLLEITESGGKTTTYTLKTGIPLVV